ncbi:uncharacterized protein [Ptychodera flava]|uniref:uncharacterized protein n=1 Tax=Ptychodera flava TaxID=63121 RepID=UPI00396A867A
MATRKVKTGPEAKTTKRLDRKTAKAHSAEVFVIMSLNLNGPKTSTATEKQEAASRILNANRPDIVCVQEIGAPKTKDWKLELPSELQDCCRNTEKEAGVIWNGATLKLVKDFDQAFKVKLLDANPTIRTQCPELAARTCIVKLQSLKTAKHIIVISWHGPHNKIKTAEKKNAVQGLQAFAVILEKKEGAPVLIGGDFNLKMEEIELRVNFCISAPSELSARRKGKENIDFFLFSDKLRVVETRVVETVPGTGEDIQILRQVSTDLEQKQRSRKQNVTSTLEESSSEMQNALSDAGIITAKVSKPEKFVVSSSKPAKSNPEKETITKSGGVPGATIGDGRNSSHPASTHQKRLTMDSKILDSLDHDAVIAKLSFV